MNLAVFGGSFDPVHLGHVDIVHYLLERGISQTVFLVPARLSPFKSCHDSSADHRLAMLRLAFAHQEQVQVHLCELERESPSYTVDTLNTLAGEMPTANLQLVLGQDNLASLGKWHEAPRVSALAELIVFARSATEVPVLDQKTVRDTLSAQNLSPRGLKVCTDFHTPVSSREVRAKLRAGTPVWDLVPLTVADYIREHDLYSA